MMQLSLEAGLLIGLAVLVLGAGGLTLFALHLRKLEHADPAECKNGQPSA